MIRVAEYACTLAIRRDVPCVELADRADLASGPVHPVQSAGPKGEYQVASRAQERLVHDEFIIAVVVKAFHAGPVTAHAMHTRRGIPGEFYPIRIERVELR